MHSNTIATKTIQNNYNNKINVKSYKSDISFPNFLFQEEMPTQERTMCPSSASMCIYLRLMLVLNHTVEIAENKFSAI